jgi:hypothetical protein
VDRWRSTFKNESAVINGVGKEGICRDGLRRRPYLRVVEERGKCRRGAEMRLGKKYGND